MDKNKIDCECVNLFVCISVSLTFSAPSWVAAQTPPPSHASVIWDIQMQRLCFKITTQIYNLAKGNQGRVVGFHARNSNSETSKFRNAHNIRFRFLFLVPF